MTLSPNAEKLYSFLKNNGCQWEDKCAEHLFPPVPFDINNKRPYYEYQNRFYGNETTFIENGIETILPSCYGDDNYSRQTSIAYQELKKAGLANEKNNGTNTYAFYTTK